MHANFASCLAFTLAHEGGVSDDPRDPGGHTNQGVTQGAFAAWLQHNGAPPRDVLGMTPAERDAIYRSRYWDAVGADRIADGVDLALFDFGVNSGPARALKALGAVTATKGAAPDGASVVRSLCARRLSFLHALATFRTFGRGWTARVVACEALGVKMAEHARIGLAPAAPTAPQVASMLRAHAQTATLRHRDGTRAGAAVAAPAASVGPPVPWLALGLTALCLAAAVGALLWRARQSRLRAAAYAAVAAAV